MDINKRGFYALGHSFQLFNRRPSAFIFLCKVSKATRTQSIAALLGHILVAAFPKSMILVFHENMPQLLCLSVLCLTTSFARKI
ncbi:hypothetical protein [Prevotella bivia]|uniref:hypothetical protein n=1 Tax=Prevotella bivia TaxID=28125 RepID=UPI0012D30A8A|nr:hypothetical protein [Prevotella bivia]